MHIDLMRDSSTTFPNVDNKDNVTSLRIWYCKYKTLKYISEFSNVEQLAIASYPDSSLDLLIPLKKLRYLSIIHLPKVTEISAVAKFENLESLSLSSLPSWDAKGKCSIVRSLEPIAMIKSLQHLELFGVCQEDRCLDVLTKCKLLKSARFSQYPKDEIENFYEKTNIENKYNPTPEWIK